MDGRKIRAQLGLDVDVGVPGLLAGQTDHLVDDVVELDLADRRIGLAGEAQQLVGDLLAAIALGADLADGALDFLEVFAGARVAFTEQIVDPARLLDHDRDRVVDLVSDSGGELADRGEAPGLDDLVGHDGSVAVGLGKSLGEVARDQITRRRSRPTRQ